MVNMYKQKPRDAFNTWKNWLNDVKNRKTLDLVKGQSLLRSLRVIPSRTLKDAYTRIVGDGSKVAGAIRSLQLKLRNNANQAFYTWRSWLN
mmetsp:Transcript_26272/g.4534  ORF Transcript_26272/g.4534 Transcript_26272/m.4534 type:complete len:91 (+) Transcript_26272:119-391(+)